MTHAPPKVPMTAPPVVDDIEEFLQAAIEDLLPLDRSPPGRGRPRILPGLCLWAGLLVCVLRGFRSQLALWRLLTQVRLWSYPRFPVSDQAVYKRLAQDGVAPLAQLWEQLNGVLGDRLAPYLPQLVPPLAPFASDILALDETTLDPVARRLPAQAGAPPAERRIPGALAGVFDIRRQQWRTIRFRPDADPNEKRYARDLLAGLLPGSLLLFDLGYFAFRWFDDLTDQGFWWISRLRRRTSYRVVQSFYQSGETFDGLVWLGAHRSDQAKHLVRLVQFRVGNQLCQYITNVRDPDRLPLADIAALYARRWDFELAVKLIKQHLGLHVWWSTKDVVIQQQLVAVLIIAQIVQAVRLEIAARAGVEVFDVSLELLVRYLPQFAARGEDPVAVFVERGRAAGFIRPSRRLPIRAPDPPLAVAWSVGAVPLTRPPRYAERKCGPRRRSAPD